MGWLLFAPVLPIGRLRRLAFLLTGLTLTALAVAVLLAAPNNGRWSSLILIWPQLCIQVRRLHDTGRSGFWVLLPWTLCMICLFGAAFGAVTSLINSEPYPAAGEPSISPSGIMILASGAAAGVIMLGWFLFLCIAPSSAKARYGAPVA